MGRLILLVIVMLGLAPGTWWRVTAAESYDERQILHLVRLPVEQDALGTSIEVEGAWELSSPNHHFSGYSALVPYGDGTLLALSDHARQLRFSEPGSPDRSVEIGYFAVLADADKRQLDLEAAARDLGEVGLAAAHGVQDDVAVVDRLKVVDVALEHAIAGARHRDAFRGLVLRAEL
jgi:hypothetical protein